MTAADRQRGIALIMALVIVAITMLIATAIFWDTHLAMRRTGNVLRYDQGWQYLRGAEDWAVHILRRDAEQSSQIDHAGEAWATPLAGLPIEGGQLGGQISDLQGRFNLNNLAHPDPAQREFYRKQFRRLLDQLQIVEPLEYAVQDWVDADNEPAGLNGAEDGFYLRNTPAYRTPDLLMASVSELRRVAGVTPEIFNLLAPHVTALPRYDAAINVNTAGIPVLVSLSEQCTPDTVARAVETRAGKPFENVDEYVATACPGAQKLKQYASVQSHYFLLRAEVAIGSLHLTLYSLLARGDNRSAVAIARSLGAF